MKVQNSANNPIRNTDVGAAKKSEAPKRGTDTSAAPKSAPPVEIADSFNASISDRGREMATAKGLAAAAPDIREDKIADLKRRIANKEYNVKPDAVAEKMIGEHLNNPGV